MRAYEEHEEHEKREGREVHEEQVVVVVGLSVAVAAPSMCVSGVLCCASHPASDCKSPV